MPIDELSDIIRLPRKGKIRLGIKVEGEHSTYPQKVDYLVCPPEVQEVYGPKPTKLDIIFPSFDLEVIAPQYYRCYRRTYGLVCKGDGKTCRTKIDLATGTLADRNTKEWEYKEMKCGGEDCPEYEQKNCRRVMNLQVILPYVKGLGVWQIDTSNRNSIINVNSIISFLKAATGGRFAMIPLSMLLVKEERQTPTGKQLIGSLHFDKEDIRMIDFLQATRAIPKVLIEGEINEDEAPDDLFPGEILDKPTAMVPRNQGVEKQEPKAQQAKTNGAAQQPKSNGSPQAQKAEEPTPSPVSTNKPRGMSSPSPDSASPQKLTTGQKKAQIWGHLYNLGLKSNRSAVETWARAEVPEFTGMEKCTTAEIDKLHAKAMLESQAGKGEKKQEAESLFPS